MKDIFGFKRKQKLKDDREAALSGIKTEEMPAADRKGFHLKNILLNGSLNAIVVLTSIVSVLDAFDVKYNSIVLYGAILAICYFIAGFYVNILWKILGYIGIVSAFIYGIMEYRMVLRGGFGTIANAFMEVIELELELPIERRYSEFTANKVYAVTLCAIFIGGALALLFNIAISETKGFILVLLITFPFVQLGLYFDRDMNIPVFIAYGAAVTALMVLRTSPYYKSETRKKKGYRLIRKKNICTYDYITDTRNGFSSLLVMFSAILLSAFLLSFILPERLMDMDNLKAWKDSTEETAKKVALVGFWGMLNPNGNGTGGIGRNKLGQVDHVNLDYQKDLDVITAVLPEEEYIYLKSYAGTVYGNNSWKYISEKEPEDYQALREYGLTEEDVASLNYNILSMDKEGRLTSYLKILRVYNTFANNMFMYIPPNTSNVERYFSDLKNDDQWIGGLDYGTGIRCRYYGLKELKLGEQKKRAAQLKEENTENKEIYDIEEQYRKYVYHTYLSVPEENQKVIDDILADNNITNEDGIDSVYEVQSFLEDNYEYTLMPGRTPSGKDFVNYFLQENKKGYCSYFASSAVLMFRRLGIPARYVGGYMVPTTDDDYRHEVRDNSEFSEKMVLSDTGETEETIYDIEVNDSNAHAWTEVYVDNLGWVTVDVTPPSDEDSEEEEDTGGIGQFLANMFFNPQTAQNIKKTTAKTITILGIAILTAILSLIIIVNILRHRRKKRTDIEKNFRYLKRIIKTAGFKWNNCKVFTLLSKELSEYNLCSNEDATNLIKILEKSRYSKTPATQNEKQEVNRIITQISQNLYTTLPAIKKIKYHYLF